MIGPISNVHFRVQMQHHHQTEEISRDPPGENISFKTRMLETGAEMIQKFNPMKSICTHFVGVHSYANQPHRQVVAHHFCSHLNEEVNQCVIYDSNEQNAKLIGIEYIISERLFQTLPQEEKKLWHSHEYEIKSGLLSCPLLPTKLENQVMQDLINTYGKTIHTWQYDKDALPIGEPRLMMSLLDQENMDLDVLRRRDLDAGLEAKEIALSRQDLHAAHPRDENSDWWLTHDKCPVFDVVDKTIEK